MAASQITGLVLTVLLLKNEVNSQAVRDSTVKRNEKICQKLGVNPFFEIDLVVGKPWRIYYTWNMQLQGAIDGICFDLVFKIATPKIVRRFSNDMYNYMAEQPTWAAATLLVTIGKAHHELLLFADQGAAGSFLGIPNMVRDGNIPPELSSVPLLKFQLKLLRESRFLIMMDCRIGVVSLLARPDRPPSDAELLSTVAVLGLGYGYPVCTGKKNDTQMLLK
ncbi:hypothetical protein ACJJTC_006031 [Scirpophaga incertulas]